MYFFPGVKMEMIRVQLAQFVDDSLTMSFVIRVLSRSAVNRQLPTMHLRFLIPEFRCNANNAVKLKLRTHLRVKPINPGEFMFVEVHYQYIEMNSSFFMFVLGICVT